jgi:hypothetical protein
LPQKPPTASPIRPSQQPSIQPGEKIFLKKKIKLHYNRGTKFHILLQMCLAKNGNSIQYYSMQIFSLDPFDNILKRVARNCFQIFNSKFMFYKMKDIFSDNGRQQ